MRGGREAVVHSAQKDGMLSMVSTLIRLITGITARWVGTDPVDAAGRAAQRVYFANHTSNLDGPVIWASLPGLLRRATRPVAAQDYWNGGAVRRFFANRVFRCVLIERKKVTKSSNPLAAMKTALEAGDSLILFPEGGRSTDDSGEMGPFKPGIWHLAKKHPNVQFVPVYLENLNRILPKGDFLFIPLMASATFGSPVPFDADKHVFMSSAREAILKLRRRGYACDDPEPSILERVEPTDA